MVDIISWKTVCVCVCVCCVFHGVQQLCLMQCCSPLYSLYTVSYCLYFPNDEMLNAGTCSRTTQTLTSTRFTIRCPIKGS